MGKRIRIQMEVQLASGARRLLPSVTWRMNRLLIPHL
jgi:hypothetical protein